MTEPDWKTRIDQEMNHARKARAEGNEGQARVCARRAAGIAIREYFRKKGESARTSSVYDLLEEIQHHPEISPTAREIAAHLRMQVEPGGVLPVNLDLIEESYRLIEELSHA